MLLDLTHNTKNGWNPLHVAIKHRNFKLFTSLLKESDINANSVLNEGFTAVHMICEMEDDDEKYQFLQALLKSKTDIDVNYQSDDGYTPLHLLTLKKNYDCCKLLLERSADPNINHTYLGNPYKMAMKLEDYRLAELLVKHGVDVTSGESDGTIKVMFSAIRNNHVSLLRQLLVNVPADFNIDQTNEYMESTGFTLLSYSVLKNMPRDVVEKMLSMGADVDFAGAGGFSPLHTACNLENYELVECLLKHKADPNLECDGSFRPLHTALKVKNEKIIRILIENGADVFQPFPIKPTHNGTLKTPAPNSRPMLPVTMIGNIESVELFTQLIKMMPKSLRNLAVGYFTYKSFKLKQKKVVKYLVDNNVVSINEVLWDQDFNLKNLFRKPKSSVGISSTSVPAVGGVDSSVVTPDQEVSPSTSESDDGGGVGDVDVDGEQDGIFHNVDVNNDESALLQLISRHSNIFFDDVSNSVRDDDMEVVDGCLVQRRNDHHHRRDDDDDDDDNDVFNRRYNFNYVDGDDDVDERNVKNLEHRDPHDAIESGFDIGDEEDDEDDDEEEKHSKDDVKGRKNNVVADADVDDDDEDVDEGADVVVSKKTERMLKRAFVANELERRPILFAVYPKLDMEYLNFMIDELKADISLKLGSTSERSILHITVDMVHKQDREFTKLFEFLLQKDTVNWNTQDWDGWAPIHICIAKGMHTPTYKLIKRKVNLNVQTADGFTPLMQATCMKNYELAETLLQAGADPNLTTTSSKKSALFYAYSRSDWEFCNLLLDYGAENIRLKIHSQSSWNVLHKLAVTKGIDYEVASKLVRVIAKQPGFNINQKESNGWTALHLATISKNYPLVKCLLEMNASVGIQTKSGWTCIHTISKLKCLKVVRKERKQTAKEKESKFIIPIAKLLIEYAMKQNPEVLNYKCDQNNTPLDYAVTNDNEEVASLLREQGAVSSIYDKSNGIIKAASRGNLPALKFIVDGDPSIDINMKHGNYQMTLLMYAIQHRSYTVAEYLLKECKADPFVSTDKGTTAFHMAFKNRKNRKLVHLLIPYLEGDNHEELLSKLYKSADVKIKKVLRYHFKSLGAVNDIREARKNQKIEKDKQWRKYQTQSRRYMHYELDSHSGSLEDRVLYAQRSGDNKSATILLRSGETYRFNILNDEYYSYLNSLPFVEDVLERIIHPHDL
eukprot:TRINITY_DN518_c0_g1_i3.p1 TRINITY_DN518_c0_g1~~TRINITY_DN518_c0_g1_i3.p1  ORF type:complete len:1178 (+),score=347.04 TRINITY_DN518_c0_g1_i3:544-4077(+)